MLCCISTNYIFPFINVKSFRMCVIVALHNFLYFVELVKFWNFNIVNENDTVSITLFFFYVLYLFSIWVVMILQSFPYFIDLRKWWTFTIPLRPGTAIHSRQIVINRLPISFLQLYVKVLDLTNVSVKFVIKCKC